MHPALKDQAFLDLDLDELRRIVRKGPKPVFATISGAHLYGFASPDSDVDLRGAFLLPAAHLLGLKQIQETFNMEGGGPRPLDWVAHDLRKFVRMMTQHNGYVLEQLYSPLVVLGGPEHDELKELGKGCLTRQTSRHYLGFARSRRERLEQGEATVKHLLYAYRVLLTGIHLMQNRQVESHLPSLNAEAGIAAIDELIARKRQGAEAMQLAEGEVEQHNAELDRLVMELHAAGESSSLPDLPQNLEQLDEFLVRVRLQ